MSGRDTGIASRLRAAGLRVVEVDAWQTRGSTDFQPGGSVNHHTAGPSSGATPSLNTCINGRPDLAGPLCNVMQSREPDGRDIAYVIAAGRANHAGEGGWRGLTGNRSVYGLEIEHTGTSALPAGRIDIAARIHAAMFSGDPANVCQHYEWAPSRKIDAATNVPGEQFRDKVRAARAPAPQPEREGFDVFAIQHTGGAIYVCGPGLFHHCTPSEWSAIAPHIAPLVGPKLNDADRDALKRIMLEASAQTWLSTVKSRTAEGKSYPSGDVLAQTELNALDALKAALEGKELTQKVLEAVGAVLALEVIDVADGPDMPPATP